MNRRALFGFLASTPVAVAGAASALPAAEAKPLEIELIKPGSFASSAQMNRIFAALRDGINDLRKRGA